MNAYKKLHIKKSDSITTDYLLAREKHFNVLVSQYKYFVLFKILMGASFLVLGSLLVIQEQMTIGQFVAAEIVIILIIGSIEKVITVIENIYDVLTALEKIGYVTDLDLDKNDGDIKVSVDKNITVNVKNMSFKFPQMKDNIFTNLNFKLESCNSAVIVGGPGTGKSTLLQLLAGIHEPTSGDIIINDIPLHHYDKDDLYKNIGFYFLSSQLFEGSIRDNITLGRDVSDDDIIEMSKLLTFSSFITSKKEGLNFIIDPSGQKLPRSIIQKILIARILISKPKFLILEDPLRFFDTEERNKIIDYIMSPERGWTVIVVSEYEYWQKKCTKVINLEN
jgi:ABC-type bacteriocin/lantibiotic exporter with double-glycine peptidase domain